MTEEPAYDDPRTLAGRLQRGRGLGARQALTHPGAADLVYACVAVDHRWDRQTEERDSYLARLVHRMDLPLAPVERRLFAAGATPEDVDLALRVLALLPFAGRLDAVDVLRRYAAEGPHWAAALDVVEESGAWQIPGIWAGLDADVAAARDDTELAAEADAARWPWNAWAHTQPRLRRILDARPPRRTPPPYPAPPPQGQASADTRALLERVASGARPGSRQALEELGRRGDPVVLDLAEDEGLRNAAGWTPGMRAALGGLGEAAVPRARGWFEGGDPVLYELAVDVLADFGDRCDGGHLLDALTGAAAAGEWCAMEAPARGLGRLRFTKAGPALAEAWQATVHSAARAAILEGLLGCAPEAAEGCAAEALDDCEPAVQEAACAVVPDTAYTRTRLRALSGDPLAPEVHGAARRRLDRFPAR